MVDEVSLAWRLADVADLYLSTAERHDIYIAIAVGDTFAAIGLLTTIAVREGVSVPRDLVAAVMQWLGAYVGNDEEPRLRALVARVKIGPTA